MPKFFFFNKGPIRRALLAELQLFNINRVPYSVVDPDPERHQNDADSHVDPTVSFTHVGKSEFFLLTFTALPVHIILSFSSTS